MSKVKEQLLTDDEFKLSENGVSVGDAFKQLHETSRDVRLLQARVNDLEALVLSLRQLLSAKKD